MKIQVSAANFKYPYDYIDLLSELKFSRAALFLFALKRGLSKYKSKGDVLGEIKIIKANTTVTNDYLCCNSNYLLKVQEDKGRVTELIGIVLTTMFAEKYLEVRKMYRFDAKSKRHFRLIGRKVADFYAYDKYDNLHILEAKGRSSDVYSKIHGAIKEGKIQTNSYPYHAGTKSACVFQILSTGNIIGHIDDPVDDLEDFKGEPIHPVDIKKYFKSKKFIKESSVEIIGDHKVKIMKRQIGDLSFSFGVIDGISDGYLDYIDPVYENDHYAISADGIVVRIDNEVA